MFLLALFISMGSTLFSCSDKNGNKQNSFSDSVVSNNADIYKVMNTVAVALYQFLEEYPERIIRIAPVDDKRKRLYNIIFQRRIHEIESNFDVFAKKGNKFEVYSPL